MDSGETVDVLRENLQELNLSTAGQKRELQDSGCTSESKGSFETSKDLDKHCPEVKDGKKHINMKTLDADQKLISNSNEMINSMRRSDRHLYLSLVKNEVTNFEHIETEFTKACPDYADTMLEDSKSYAFEFACHILFRVEPQSVRNKIENGMWIFKIFETTASPDTKKLKATIIVLSHCRPIVTQTFTYGKLALKMKQASLLATTMLIKYAIATGKPWLPPLVRAVFSEDDLPKIVDALQMAKDDLITVYCSIIASCPSGGQYIKESECHIAVCAAIVATKDMRSEILVKNIVRNIIKRYKDVGKHLDYNKLKIYCKFAAGGIPMNYTSEELLSEIENVKPFTLGQISKIQRDTDFGATSPQSGDSGDKADTSGSTDENRRVVDDTNLTPEGGAIKKTLTEALS